MAKSSQTNAVYRRDASKWESSIEQIVLTITAWDVLPWLTFPPEVGLEGRLRTSRKLVHELAYWFVAAIACLILLSISSVM
jgi:hypothetical protein